MPRSFDKGAEGVLKVEQSLLQVTLNMNRRRRSLGGDWTTAQDRGRLQSACGGALLCTELPQPDLDRVTGRGPPSSWTANNTLSKGKIHLGRNREMKARTHLRCR